MCCFIVFLCDGERSLAWDLGSICDRDKNVVSKRDPQLHQVEVYLTKVPPLHMGFSL